MADNNVTRDVRFYATAPFTGKAGKAAAEKFERRAAEKAKNDK